MKRAAAIAVLLLSIGCPGALLAQVTPFTAVNVGNGPEVDIADTIDGKVFVVNLGSNSVSVLDPVTWTKTADIPTGTGPRRARINNTTHNIYVTKLATGTSPRAACVNTTTNRVYVPAFSSNNVTVLDGATNTAVAGSPVTVGVGASQCLVDEATNRIFISNDTDGTFSVIDGFV